MINLVTFEQAKRLNRFGYSVPSAHGYYTKGSGKYVTIQQYREEREYQLIPSWLFANAVSEALDWIRENYKGLFLSVRFNSYPKPSYVGRVDYLPKFNCTETKSFESHSDCNSSLLDAVLTYLEENNHGNK